MQSCIVLLKIQYETWTLFYPPAKRNIICVVHVKFCLLFIILFHWSRVICRWTDYGNPSCPPKATGYVARGGLVDQPSHNLKNLRPACPLIRPLLKPWFRFRGTPRGGCFTCHFLRAFFFYIPGGYIAEPSTVLNAMSLCFCNSPHFGTLKFLKSPRGVSKVPRIQSLSNLDFVEFKEDP